MDTVEKHLNSLDHQEQQPRMCGCLSEPLNWMLSALTLAGSLGRQASRLLGTSRCCPRGQGHKSWRVLMEPFLRDDMLLTMPFCCTKCDGSPRPRKARSQPGFHPLGRSREERPFYLILLGHLFCLPYGAEGLHKGSTEAQWRWGCRGLRVVEEGSPVHNSLQISGIIKI